MISVVGLFMSNVSSNLWRRLLFGGINLLTRTFVSCSQPFVATKITDDGYVWLVSSLGVKSALHFTSTEQTETEMGVYFVIRPSHMHQVSEMCIGTRWWPNVQIRCVCVCERNDLEKTHDNEQRHTCIISLQHAIINNHLRNCNYKFSLPLFFSFAPLSSTGRASGRGTREHNTELSVFSLPFFIRFSAYRKCIWISALIIHSSSSFFSPRADYSSFVRGTKPTLQAAHTNRLAHVLI